MGKHTIRPGSSADEARATQRALVRKRRWCVCVCHSLCCYLDELLEELHSLTELAAQADLGDHPQLNLVEPVQKQVQIGRGSPEVLPAESVVQQLMLGRKMQENECWTVQLLLPHNDASLIFFFHVNVQPWGVHDLMHAAEEFPVKHGHLVGQILRAHQLKGGHGACRGTLLVWKMSLMHRQEFLTA